jgi:hypothetical protein
MDSNNKIKKKSGTRNMVTLEILEPHSELAFLERKGLFAPLLLQTGVVM